MTALLHDTSHNDFYLRSGPEGSLQTLHPIKRTVPCVSVTADNKHVGVLVLKKGAMAQPATVTWSGGLLVGMSTSDVCDICKTRRGLDLIGADQGVCLAGVWSRLLLDTVMQQLSDLLHCFSYF